MLWFLDGFEGQGKHYGQMANELARRMGEKSWEWWVHTAEIQQESVGEGRWDEALVLSAAVLAETEAVAGQLHGCLFADAACVHLRGARRGQ